MVVCVISASSSVSLLPQESLFFFFFFVIYSIGLFASLSLSLFCVCVFALQWREGQVYMGGIL